jgi:hypothetical protein
MSNDKALMTKAVRRAGVRFVPHSREGLQARCSRKSLGDGGGVCKGKNTFFEF